LLVATCCPAQDLDIVRRDLREDLRSVNFAQSLISLVLLSDELELGSGSFTIRDQSNTRISTISLPFHSQFTPWRSTATRLYTEGALGYAEAKQTTSDFYGGAAPTFRTSLTSRWRSYGAVGGVGLSYQLREDLSITPILSGSLVHLDNRTDYGGPGATTTAAIADGIAFNWDALALTYGTALRVDWQHQIDATKRLEVIARYDILWSQTVQTDDPAQDFTVRSQMMTVRGDLYGPTNATLFDASLD
jgi:hypothetical protein